MTQDGVHGGADAWRNYAPETQGFSDLGSRVHVWRMSHHEGAKAGSDILSADEAERAEDLTDADQRRRFIAGRRLLRAILADILAPNDTARGRPLTLAYDAAGKPRLGDDPSLRFNLCHAEDMTFLAVTRSGPVGIAVERRLDLRQMRDLARRLFTDAEQAALMGCLPGSCETVFNRIWTRKTALFKAAGGGAATADDRPSQSVPRPEAGWILTTLPNPIGPHPTLARPRAAHGLRLWSWPSAPRPRAVERRSRPREGHAVSRLSSLSSEAIS